MAIYKHQCGQTYIRRSENTRPRHCLVICERCLEPMPVCDEDRAAFVYQPLQDFAFKRVLAPLTAGFSPATKRPTLKETSVTPLFSGRGGRSPWPANSASKSDDTAA